MKLEMVQMMIKLYKAVYGATKPFIPTVLATQNKIVIDSGTTHVFIDYPGCIEGLESRAIILDKKTLEQMGKVKKDIVFKPDGWVAGAVAHQTDWEYYLGGMTDESLDSVMDLRKVQSIELDALDFKAGIQAVKTAIRDNDQTKARPVLANMAFKNGELVGIDGFRVHTYELKKDIEAGGLALITKAAFSVLEKLITKKDSKLMYTFDGDGSEWSLLQYGNVRVYSKSVGEYMNYEQVFPELPIEVKVYPEELYNLVEQINNEKAVKPIAILSLPTGNKVETLKVELHAQESDAPVVKIEDSLPVEVYATNGKARENLHIAFNPQYLSEAIKPIKGEDEVTLYFGTNLGPMVVKGGQVKNLILPIRIRDYGRN